MNERLPIENPNEGEKSLEQKMAEFRAEVVELKTRELSGEEPTSHFRFGELKPEELTEKDMITYEKFKNGNLTLDEFNDYRDEIAFLDITHKTKGIGESVEARGLLVGYIANKLAGAEAERLLAEIKKRKKAEGEKNQ